MGMRRSERVAEFSHVHVGASVCAEVGSHDFRCIGRDVDRWLPRGFDHVKTELLDLDLPLLGRTIVAATEHFFQQVTAFDIGDVVLEVLGHQEVLGGKELEA